MDKDSTITLYKCIFFGGHIKTSLKQVIKRGLYSDKFSVLVFCFDANLK